MRRGARRGRRARRRRRSTAPTGCASAAPTACCAAAGASRRGATDGRRRVPARPRAARRLAVSAERDAGAPGRLRGPAAHVRGRRLDRPRLRGPRRSGTSSTGRDLAQARRLAYGSVQRRGTSDHLIARARRPPRRQGRRGRARGAAARPLRAALLRDRPTTPRSTRRSSWPSTASAAPGSRAPAPAPPPGSSTRCCAGPPPSATSCSARSTTRPRRRRGRPLLSGLAGAMWWAELGPARGAAADGGDERARRDRPAGQHAALRPASGGGASCARPGWRSTAPGAGALLDPADGLVVDAAAEPVGARIADRRAGRRSRAARRPSSRCSIRSRASACSTSAPARGSRRPRSPRGWARRGEIVSIEVDPRRAAEIEELCARARARARARVEVADAAEADLGSGYDRILLDPPCSDLGTLASRPDARWRKSPADPRAAGRACSAGCWSARRGRCARAARSSTRPARSRPARTRSVAGGARRVRRRASRPTTSAPLIRGSPRARDRRFLQLLPERDRTTGFFSRAFGARRAADGRRPRDQAARPARAAASRGCARRSCPGRYRCVYCLRRYELVSGCPNCGEHQTMVRMSADEDLLCQHCGHSMLNPV